MVRTAAYVARRRWLKLGPQHQALRSTARLCQIGVVSNEAPFRAHPSVVSWRSVGGSIFEALSMRATVVEI